MQINDTKNKMKLNKKFKFKNILKSAIQNNEVASSSTNISKPFRTADEARTIIESEQQTQKLKNKRRSDITDNVIKSNVSGDILNLNDMQKSKDISERQHLIENEKNVTDDKINKKCSEEGSSSDLVNVTKQDILIQQMQNDLIALEKDVFFKKMHHKKLKFYKRRYKLDMKHSRLVASTGRCCMRERVYELEDLCEVNGGAGSVNLQAFINKNQSKKEEVDNLAFEITYDNFKKSLNLMANNQMEKKRWINALSYLIKEKNKYNNTDWTQDDEYFFKLIFIFRYSIIAKFQYKV